LIDATWQKKRTNWKNSGPSKYYFWNNLQDHAYNLLFPVENKTQQTLFPIIQNHVQEGAQIILDKFSSYVSRNGVSHLDQLGSFFNFSFNFKFNSV